MNELKNTGDYNTGDCNTGDYNTGDYNTGKRNTGYYNTGNCNTGDYNTGYRNTGNRNTGDYNTGDYNTGYYNTGNRNTGDCNNNNPTVRIFNKDSGWKFNSKIHLKFRGVISKYQQLKCEWVYARNMTDLEKENNITHKATGGYLKVNGTTYNGKKVAEEDREFLESVPNFDADILRECTGIVFDTKKIITIDGKDIEISQDSYEAFKKQFLE